MPERIEDYEVLGVIGTGSFGTCYKVRKKNTSHVFVWKAVDYGSMSEERKKLLVSEVNVLRELRHPNIVRYFDRIIHKESTTIYIIMEWCEGGDLAALIGKCRRTHAYVAEAFVWKTLYQTSRALQACHGPGRPVLHRDIKPANLFLDAQFNIKLGDFGLARVLSSNDTKRDDTEECYAQTVVGTPFYMSPEVVKGSKYNRKSDIWSLGCVIYELCCLRPPFSNQNVKVLAQRIKEGKFSRIPSHYSEDLHNIIVFMMTVDHDVRPSVDAILHHPSVVTRIPSWSQTNSNCCTLSAPIEKIQPGKPKEVLDETFCSCENDCCSGDNAVYAEIGNPISKVEDDRASCSHPPCQSSEVKHLGLIFPPSKKAVNHPQDLKKSVLTKNFNKTVKQDHDLHVQVGKEKLEIADKLEILRQREAKLRMKELTLDERERAVQKKEREAALASRLARETMGRACVYLNTCKSGRGSSASTVTKITMRSRSPSDKAQSIPDADSSLDREHGDTSYVARTSTKLDPRAVGKPSWSLSRKVKFDLKDAPQVIDGFAQDSAIIDNSRNAGILSSINGKMSSAARPSSWSDNYYWLESKKQAFRERNSGKENKVPVALSGNKKLTQKNVLHPVSQNVPSSGIVHSQIL
ncbi:serine/threonine-protein kinase Nek1-like [Ischnura elegans]|uniref:serine/threonine-protein kinase Nek1-like n=1 Tax=Ischnura elegans TaxID=197161 RepID=UPI001ED87A4B|nr:serine/threonine-protein kinase Nek1-like [Ischnura elegans]XP_046390275.1 serine/threonine-protein kinase Nek1-like [Ischnura elegans]